MAAVADEPVPLREEDPPVPTWHVPAHLWHEPDLHIRPHYLERQRQRSATGPATDDDSPTEGGR